MNLISTNLAPALPEMFLLVSVLAILMLDLVLADEQRGLIHWFSVLALGGSALLSLQQLQAGAEVVYLFNNMFVSDPLGHVLKLATYASAALTLAYSRDYIKARGMFNVEFYSLALFAVLGMMVMISASHFMTLYLGLELMSLSIYAMVALQRDSARATEAALKYFVLGALASGMLLFGMSMLYGATGSLDIAVVAQKIASGNANPTLNAIGVVFVVAGLAFKLGAVPFHMWVPDVYEGSPTAVTLFIGSAPKLAAFAFVIRMLAVALAGLAVEWQQMLVILAVLSMALGNLTAIAQTNVKRMLAYSAISHMGFMLLGIVTGVVGGDARYALNAYSSAMFYVIAYVLMSAGTFGMILMMSRAGFEADELEDLKGLNKRSPWFAGVMLMLMFSMAGVPFFIGFFAKFSVLQAVVAAGYIWLAIVAVLFSLIGAFYYLRVVKLMYFDAPADETPLSAGMDMRILISANGLAVAFLGLFPQVIMSLCAYALLRSL